jgi:WG containing repeat
MDDHARVTATTEPELFPFTSETGWWGYRTAANEVAIPCRFEVARRFAEGLAAVQQDWRWGFVDAGGAFRIEPRFEEARSFSDGLAAVEVEPWGYVDRQGRLVWKSADWPEALDATGESEAR